MATPITNEKQKLKFWLSMDDLVKRVNQIMR